MQEPVRKLPVIPIYRGDDPNLRIILSKIREAIEILGEVGYETHKDIKCRRLEVYDKAEIGSSLFVDGVEK